MVVANQPDEKEHNPDVRIVVTVESPRNERRIAVEGPRRPAHVAAAVQAPKWPGRPSSLASGPIVSKVTRAPGNDAPVGGLKLITRNGWFTTRPSGTENVYKTYAESFDSEEHLNRILEEAQGIVDGALGDGRA